MKTLEPILLIDENQGVYIPKVFCEQCNPDNSFWVWDYENDGEILLNPEHELYWEVWDEILNNAFYHNPDENIKYTLYHNGDLWLIPEGYEIVEEF
jgi:hypothetical protein